MFGVTSNFPIALKSPEHSVTLSYVYMPASPNFFHKVSHSFIPYQYTAESKSTPERFASKERYSLKNEKNQNIHTVLVIKNSF